ncbi:MAG: tRNA epoxyqueuosine(34) reductase QueG [Anaerolineae bacterium]
MDDLASAIKAQAQALGFTLAGIAPAQPGPGLDAYLRWIEAGMHGTMAYMARPDRVARRRDLSVILPGARSLIVVGLDYYTAPLPSTIAEDPARARISNYAWGLDYHAVMTPRLEELAHFLTAAAGGAVRTRVYVDTGAILERSHAAEAGLGFIGKNTMLIHPRQGSFSFLGEIITDLPLPHDDPPRMPGCGSCTRCLAACPTGAFPRPYVLDARRCISYLTIEHRGTIPPDLRPLMGRWVYGCDVCQEVCPWGRFAAPRPESAPFAAVSADRAAPRLENLLALDDESFRVLFAGSAITRIGRDRLVRNACIAGGNSGLPGLAPALTALLDDRSPLVRGHAAWALGRLGAGGTALRTAYRREGDEDVRTEIRRALAGPADQPPASPGG